MKVKINEMKTITAECVGECPHCGSNDLDYRGLEIQDDYAWYPFSCNNCDAVGSEGYHLKYDNTEVDVSGKTSWETMRWKNETET